MFPSKKPAPRRFAVGRLFAKATRKVIPKGKIDELIEYLEDDLPKLFEKGEVDENYFEDVIDFQDPITKYNSLNGYLFNIKLLLVLFSPVFELHRTYQSGENEITTRWTMTMDFKILPWRPQVVFTGISIYGINPITGKFNSHIDVWDSIEDQKYFSSEGLWDLINQSSRFSTKLDNFSPPYKVLKRLKDYEIREYQPFSFAEVQILPSIDFFDSKNIRDQIGIVNSYASGENEKSSTVKKGLPLTFEWETEAPLATQTVKTKIVLDPKSTPSGVSLPIPTNPQITVGGTDTKVFAAFRIGGPPNLGSIVAFGNSSVLKLRRDDLKPKSKAVFAGYTDSFSLPVFERNELWIELEDFSLL